MAERKGFDIARPRLPRNGSCRFAILGDAPDDDCMQFGWQAEGPNWRILQQILRTADIDWRDCLVTNVFDQRPPADDVAKWTLSRAEAAAAYGSDVNDYAGRSFEPEFLRRNLARLQAEMDECQPCVIIPTGPAALWALTGSISHSASRGALSLSSQLRPGTLVLPTYSADFVRRQWKYFTVVVADLVKADKASDTPGRLTHLNRQLWIRPRLDDLRTFDRQFLQPSPAISVDIETMRVGRQITCIGFGTADGTAALCVPFVDWSKPSRNYWRDLNEELEAWQWVEKICGNSTAKLLQNGLYDTYWLWDLMGIRVNNYCEDTRLLHHALYPELPKDLAFMGATYAQIHAWKEMRQGAKTAMTKRDD